MAAGWIDTSIPFVKPLDHVLMLPCGDQTWLAGKSARNQFFFNDQDKWLAAMISCFLEICSSKTNTFRKYFDGRSRSNNLSGIYPLVIIKDLQVVQRFPNLRSGNKKSRTLPTMHVTGRKKYQFLACGQVQREYNILEYIGFLACLA